jgi:cbb3-type cytochrome oxidase subunit 1
MQGVARWFFTVAVVFAIVGMGLGLKMGLTQTHDQIPTHAHAMLVGWVNSALMGYFYHLFPAVGASRLAQVHFLLQTAGAIVLTASLWFIYAGNPAFGAGAGAGAIGVLLGMLLFAWIALRRVWKA